MIAIAVAVLPIIAIVTRGAVIFAWIATGNRPSVRGVTSGDSVGDDLLVPPLGILAIFPFVIRERGRREQRSRQHAGDQGNVFHVISDAIVIAPIHSQGLPCLTRLTN
jgi:hypothetical protein